MDFDWEAYCARNPDLLFCGINTKERATDHWLRYGKRENRICSLSIREQEEINKLTLVYGSRQKALIIFFREKRHIILIFHIGNLATLDKILERYPEVRTMRKIISYYDDEIEKKIINFELKEEMTNIICKLKIQNKGCDIGPFLKVLKYLHENSELYDDNTLFIKIHTKTDDIWRNKMIDSLLKSDFSIDNNVPIIYGSEKYCYSSNKRVNHEYIKEIIKHEEYYDYIDEYYPREFTLSNDENKAYDGLDYNDEFYRKYEPDIAHSSINNHFELYGKNEFHRISNVNYIKKYAKYEFLFFAGTMFAFNRKYLDIFRQFNLDKEFESLEDGYIINDKPKRTHAWEYIFGIITFLEGGRIMYKNNRNIITKLPRNILPKQKEYSKIYVPFTKSKYAFFMICPNDVPSSGGYRTLLEYINLLNKKRLSVDLYFAICHYDNDIMSCVMDLDENGMPKCENISSNKTITSYIENIKKYGVLDIEKNNYYYGFRCQRNYEYIVANAWQTAGAVLKNCDKCDGELLYIIQDIEYEFYPDDIILQKNVKKTYVSSFNYYCLSKFLYNKFRQFPKVYESTLSYNGDIYKAVNKDSRSNEVVIPYYAGLKKNRVNELVEEIIELCIKEKIKCHIFPEKYTSDSEYIVNHGTMKVNELNELYNRAKVGIIFSNSNPSRLPFEMYASGLHVIEYDCEYTKYDLPDKIFTKIKDSNNVIEIIKSLFSKEMIQDDDFMKSHEMAEEYNSFIKFAIKN